MPADNEERSGQFMVPDDFRPLIPELELAEMAPALSDWLSGDAAFAALKRAVDELAAAAPKDHDVLIEAFGIAVKDVRYMEPHTFLFTGHNAQGHQTAVVCHFSQLVAHVVYLPQRGSSRVITGFSSAPAELQSNG